MMLQRILFILVLFQMRKIAIFTGTRAEYSLLKPLLQGIQHHPCLDLQLIVSGSHLAEVHGMTVDAVLADGFVPDACVPVLLAGGATSTLHDCMGRALQGYGAVLQNLEPDIVVLLGDRYEAFCMAAAATANNVPLAHIHGGELTLGAMDDVFRHAITKMSHLHFASCERYRQRILQLGEQPDRVWQVGALGVENVHSLPLLAEQEIRNFLGMGSQPYLLCTFHPVTLEPGCAVRHVHNLLTALAAFPAYGVVFTGANSDPEGEAVNILLQEHCRHSGLGHAFFLSLGGLRYLSAARYAACVLGNSSSGIVEVPSLGTPVLDIGDRQAGRERAACILHSSPEVDDIVKKLQIAVSPAQRECVRTSPNPYDTPGTSAAILDVLHTFPLKKLSRKVFYDLP